MSEEMYIFGPLQIAAYFLYKARNDKKIITKIHIHRLVFLSYCSFLIMYNKKMFKEQTLINWSGPIYQSVFEAFYRVPYEHLEYQDINRTPNCNIEELAVFKDPDFCLWQEIMDIVYRIYVDSKQAALGIYVRKILRMEKKVPWRWKLAFKRNRLVRCEDKFIMDFFSILEA